MAKSRKTSENSFAKSHEVNGKLISSIEIIFDEVFNEEEFIEKIFNKLTTKLNHEEFGLVVLNGLQRIFPFYKTEIVVGNNENKNSTNILMKIPCILSNYEYGITIQIKDYYGFIREYISNQNGETDKYSKLQNLKIIEKIVIITNAPEVNSLHQIGKEQNVKFIFANELKQLLCEIGKSFIKF